MDGGQGASCGRRLNTPFIEIALLSSYLLSVPVLHAYWYTPNRVGLVGPNYE